MTTLRFIEWFAIAAVVTFILQAVQIPLRTGGSVWVYLLGFIIKAVAAVGIAFCCMAFCSKFFWNLGYLPAVLYAVLLCDAAADLIALIIRIVRGTAPGFQTVMLVSILLTAGFVIYGTVNMQIIVPKEHVYTSEKLHDKHTFVFVADLHYSASQSESTVDKAFREIADLKPEFVLLGGDITDDRTTAEDMHEAYKKLGSLGVPVYYIYGNHDRQSHADYLGGAKYTPEELEETILSNGITILRDEIAVLADDLVVLGREDSSEADKRCAVSELPERPEDAYVICVDHSPYEEEDILATGADLQLSGHTHAGQFFPLQYVYRISVNNIYGDYKVGSTDLYVSSGITGWYFPFRTVARCNYEVITLMPR